jgi:hypothetical protein
MATMTLTRTCAVDDCVGEHLARGLCGKHYWRQRTHGTTDDRPSRRIPMVDRLWPRIVATPGGCWIWSGARTRGYGVIADEEGRLRYVHRVVFELLVEPIADGLVIDHLCRVHACCRPLHLDAVSDLANWRRGTSPSARVRQTGRCVKGGHLLTPDNVYVRRDGSRLCRTCIRLRERAR